MKKYIIYALAISTLGLVGCSKDFLETEPSEKISAEQLADAAAVNPDVVAGTVRGLYALMYLSGTGGTTGHDDVGQKGVDIWTDMLSADIAHQNTSYGWYRTFSSLQATLDFTTNPNYIPWRYYYRIIRSANTVIESLGGNDFTPALKENKHFMGQAKAMRAYSYFYLTQLYGIDAYDAGKEILPLYITPTSQAQAKAKTSDIFDQIIKDLDDSIVLLGDFNRQFKNEINKYIAESLLAYVYAAKGDYTKTKTLTNDVIANGGFTIMGSNLMTAGFNDIATPGWMWGTDLTTEMNLGLDSWWAQMDVFTYGYQSSGNEKAIDKSLFDLIPANDVRKGQFNANLLPINKFYAPARIWDGQRPVLTDYMYMRISEIYLLNAEAAAKTGDEARAKSSLKAIVSKRVPNASYIDALTGQALLDEINLQLRIEHWGEGKSYLALKRNKGSIVRGANHLFFVGETIPYNDDRLSFEIPQAEIQNNTLINSQN